MQALTSPPVTTSRGGGGAVVAAAVTMSALCLMGAVSGVAIGLALESPLNARPAPVVGRFQMSWVDAGLALGIATGPGLVIGLPPAVAARRLSIVRALREIS